MIKCKIGFRTERRLFKNEIDLEIMQFIQNTEGQTYLRSEY